MFPAGERAAADAGRLLACEHELDRVGVQPDGEAGAGGDGFAMQLGEARLGTPAREVGVETVEFWRGLVNRLPNVVVLMKDVLQALKLEGAGVERVELGPG